MFILCDIILLIVLALIHDIDEIFLILFYSHQRVVRVRVGVNQNRISQM